MRPPWLRKPEATGPEALFWQASVFDRGRSDVHRERPAFGRRPSGRLHDEANETPALRRRTLTNHAARGSGDGALLGWKTEDLR